MPSGLIQLTSHLKITNNSWHCFGKSTRTGARSAWITSMAYSNAVGKEDMKLSVSYRCYMAFRIKMV